MIIKEKLPSKKDNVLKGVLVFFFLKIPSDFVSSLGAGCDQHERSVVSVAMER